MSAVEYTRCDGEICGRVTPNEPGDYANYLDGWVHVTWQDAEWDFCPECAAKMFEAVGIKGVER